MDPVSQARAIAEKAEEITSMDLAGAYPSGQNQRAYDYIKVALPLMIEAHEGRDPGALPGITERQLNLLGMTSGDAQAKILRDEESARRMLGWVTPHSPDEVRHFITRTQSPSDAMLETFLVSQEERNAPDVAAMMAKITNSMKNPLNVEMFEMARLQEINANYKPGDQVKLTIEGKNGNPFAGETRTIDEVRLSYNGGASYYAEHRMENDTEWYYTGQLLDPRARQHGYGVVTETAGKLYYVELERAEQYYEDSELRVREIVGVDHGMQKRTEFAAGENSDAIMTRPTMREVLNIGEGQDARQVTGEFAYHPMKSHDDFNGPIIIQAHPWGAPTNTEDAERVRSVIEKHLQKYEYGETPAPAEQASTSRMKETSAPSSEYIRVAQQAHNLAGYHR